MTIYNQIKDLGYDVFDINSEFYNDICIPYKTPQGTDIILSDRINYYFNNEETQCQFNCRFSEYSLEKHFLKCECDFEDNEINFENSNFNSKYIYESFYNVLKFSNYKVLKCYNLTFNLNIFKNNEGNKIAIIFFVFYLILLFVYFIKGITSFKIDISKNILDIKNKFSDNNNNKDNINPKDIQSKKLKKTIITKKYNKLKENHKSLKSKLFSFPPKKNKTLKKKSKISDLQILNIDNSKSKYLLENNGIQEMNKAIFPTKREQNLDNYELNNLEYNIALNLDKRNFFEIYLSFLRRENLFIFTFFVCNDHNLIYVKYSRFIFLFCSDMALNVFFFADETMHKMFLDYGKYNFIQQIPQILYSTVISQILEIFLCYLSLTDKHYYKAKNIDIKSKFMILQIIKCVKIKLFFFYLSTGLILCFYWYTITCFCAVYENTQSAFIKDSLLSFGLGLLYPFIIYLFPTLLRLLSLKSKNGKLSFVYNLSDIIPFF